MREPTTLKFRSAPALQLVDVTSGYGALMVLRNVNLSVPAGSIVALLGKNGVGKTTLLKSILGFLPKQRGAVPVSYTHLTLPTIYSV